LPGKKQKRKTPNIGNRKGVRMVGQNSHGGRRTRGYQLET